MIVDWFNFAGCHVMHMSTSNILFLLLQEFTDGPSQTEESLAAELEAADEPPAVRPSACGRSSSSHSSLDEAGSTNDRPGDSLNQRCVTGNESSNRTMAAMQDDSHGDEPVGHTASGSPTMDGDASR